MLCVCYVYSWVILNNLNVMLLKHVSIADALFMLLPCSCSCFWITRFFCLLLLMRCVLIVWFAWLCLMLFNCFCIAYMFYLCWHYVVYLYMINVLWSLIVLCGFMLLALCCGYICVYFRCWLLFLILFVSNYILCLELMFCIPVNMWASPVGTDDERLQQEATL